MNDDKMRAEFEKWANLYELDLQRLNEGYISNASNNCWTVWQAAYAAGRKAEREAIFIEWENGELLAAEVERLRGELAAAKAASVCPVELVALGDADWECSVGVKCKSSEDADTLYNWLRDRMKERGEG